MDFEQIVLPRPELRMLRAVFKSPAENCTEWANKLDDLIEMGFVSLEMYEDADGKLASAFFVTKDGEHYLQYLKRRKSETRFANTMSVLAFIVSVIALIVSIVK